MICQNHDICFVYNLHGIISHFLTSVPYSHRVFYVTTTFACLPLKCFRQSLRRPYFLCFRSSMAKHPPLPTTLRPVSRPVQAATQPVRIYLHCSTQQYRTPAIRPNSKRRFPQMEVNQSFITKSQVLRCFSMFRTLWALPGEMLSVRTTALITTMP